jgi:hypothetical protein
MLSEYFTYWFNHDSTGVLFIIEMCQVCPKNVIRQRKLDCLISRHTHEAGAPLIDVGKEHMHI